MTPGRWGTGCNMTCGRGCPVQGKCDLSTGTCLTANGSMTTSCKAGYIGTLCNQVLTSLCVTLFMVLRLPFRHERITYSTLRAGDINSFLLSKTQSHLSGGKIGRNQVVSQHSSPKSHPVPAV